MNKRVMLDDLIGRTIDPKYRLKDLIEETRKSWVFRAIEEGELSPHRNIAIKILKPGQAPEREAQFRREVERLADVGEHPNLTTLYGSGKDSDLCYIAMEYIPGLDLHQEIERGKKFSLEEILNIMTDITEAVTHIYEIAGKHHQDIKLKNIKPREEIKEGKKRKTYTVDLGGRLKEVKESNDIYAMGLILKELLNHRENLKQKIPRRLEQIVKKSTISNGYASPLDFQDAIGKYKLWNTKIKLLKIGPGITRKEFLKIGAAGLALAGIGYLKFRHLDYINSIDHVVNEISKVEATDYANINPLFKELALRIFDQKIRWLVESGKIPRGKSPYATIENGSWFLTEGGYWTEGFWPGILLNAYEATGKEEYKKWATEWTREIDFTEKESNDIRSMRFYYSHAKAFELTRDEFFRNKALRAAEFMASRFNEVGNYIQMSGELTREKNHIIKANSIKVLPLIWFAFETLEDKRKYYNIAYNHLQSILRYNIREDYSVRDFAVFNPKRDILIEEQNFFGYAPDSCCSRTQARAIQGFSLAYEKIKNPDFLLTAEKLADYFINHLPEDFIPFYDFDDPNEKLPKDSSAAAIASSALLNLYKITGNEKYKRNAYNMLKSLSSRNYLSTDLKKYQGIIMHGCYDKRQGYINSSLIYGDYFYLESLGKIK